MNLRISSSLVFMTVLMFCASACGFPSGDERERVIDTPGYQRYLTQHGLKEHPVLKSGDIVFHQSKSSQSPAIQDATGSVITHMGIIFIQEGRRLVYEAVSPMSKPEKNRVGLTPYLSWVNRGKDKKVWVKRLSPNSGPLDEDTLNKMYQVGLRFKGKRYDGLFQWDKEKIYCSELVYDIYNLGAGISLGQVQRIKDLNLKPKSVQILINARLGKNLDVDEKIITPVSIFEDKRLVTIIQPK